MSKRLLLLLTAPLVMGDGPPPQLRKWWLEQPLAADQTVDVDLVRANVRQTTAEGPLRIEITAHGPQAGAVQVRFERSKDGVSVKDVYPADSIISVPTECEPPSGERGAFWRSDVVFDVLIRTPPSVKSRIHLMEDYGKRDAPHR